jgi:outer membrane receptor protein involved in Fe transport
MSVDVRPVSLLTLRARADYVNGTNTATDEPLPLMPPLSGSAGAEVRSEHVGGARPSYVSLETEVFTEQSRLSEFDVQTPAYALVRVDAGIAPRLWGRTFNVDLQVHNLLDTAYRSYLSRYKELALNPGRNVVMRVGTSF